jgi:GTP:adenosylcobinamide-phosphate guanylyltransferase
MNQQLYDRTIQTLLDNCDAVVVGVVADEEMKIYFKGRDEYLVPLIDQIGTEYIRDIMNDHG